MDESAKRGMKLEVMSEPDTSGQNLQRQGRPPLRLRIDLERLVSDGAYREEIRRRLQERSV